MEGRERSSWDEVPSLYRALVSLWKVDPVFIHGWRVNSGKPGAVSAGTCPAQSLAHAGHQTHSPNGFKLRSLTSSLPSVTPPAR